MLENDDKGQVGQNEPSTLRQRYLERLTMLRAERSSWITHYQELSDNIFPRRFRYLQTDRNKGTKRNDKIINNKPTISVRILAAGKMAGMTSPARPWGRFVVPNPMLSDDQEVREWLAIAEKIFFETMAKSNLYNCLHEVYGIQATFATSAMYIQEDDEDDVRGVVFPIGQFCLATDDKQRVDTITREFSMTVAQMVKAFGLKNCSMNVQQMYNEGKYDVWREIVHFIEPNRNRKVGMADNKNMPYLSVWIEREAGENWNRFLRVSGYEEFPVMVARWFVTGEDAYGSGSPGMDSLGDCKALQLMERRSAQAVDKMVQPPMQAPVSMKKERLSLLPGDTTFVPDGQQSQFKPSMELHPESVTVAQNVIEKHERRIGIAFFTDLFMMMLEDDARQPRTARDINERHEEKMLQLGPVVERDEDELLDPMINRVMHILLRKGKVPPPPAKLNGQRIKIEYISIMAEAQKLLGTASIERITSFIGSISAIKPEVMDLINYDKLVVEYSKMLGVPPDLINPEKVVAQMRQARQQAQQQQAELQQAESAAKSAQVASQTELGKDSMLDRLMAGVGYSPPGSGGRS